MVDEVEALVLEFAQVADRAVGEEMDLGVRQGRVGRAGGVGRGKRGTGERIGKLDGVLQPGGGIRRGRPGDGAAQGSLARRGGLADLGGCAGHEHDHLVVVAQAVDEREGLGTGLLKTVGRLVGCLHRSGGVEDHDAQPTNLGFAGEVGARQGEHGENQQENLEQEQPVLPQLLKWGVGLVLREEPLPEQRAGDETNGAAALQQVEDDHRRDEPQKPKRGWRKEVHSLGSGGFGALRCFRSSFGDLVTDELVEGGPSKSKP